MPDKYLKDKNNEYILDKKREKIKNPEYKEYTDKWGEPTEDNKSNLSLPKKVILDENDNIQFKGEK